MSKYVQHVSGQGAKWKVKCENRGQYGCVGGPNFGDYWLPKSEYIEVPEPDVWTDVTRECELFEDVGFHGLLHNGVSRYQSTEQGHEDYRLSKVQLWTVRPSTNLIGEIRWAFIIERREP